MKKYLVLLIVSVFAISCEPESLVIDNEEVIDQTTEDYVIDRGDISRPGEQ